MNRKTAQVDRKTPEPGVSVETVKPVVNARSKSDKRVLARKIRHLLAKRVTSIYISDVSIKVTVAKGRELEKWVVSLLEPGIVINGIVIDQDRLGAKLLGLLKELNHQTNEVFVGLSGLYAITRTITLPVVPAKVLAEAISHEAERELPVPPDTVYLSWQVIEQNAQDTKVLLVAYARNNIDALVNTLRKTGLKQYSLELAPLALVRNVNEPTSVVFDVRPGEMDIVILNKNVPELCHSVPLPLENSVEESLPIILDELQRTINFYQPANPTDRLPIFGFGDLDTRMLESLSISLNHHIRSSPPPFYYPPGFSPEGYSVNLGLTMGKVKIPDTAYRRKVKINLLPERFKEKIISTRVKVIAGASLALAVLIAGFIQVRDVSINTETIRGQLVAADQLLMQRQAERLVLQREADNLSDQAMQSLGVWETYENSSTMLAAEQTVINDDLKLVLAALPSGMALSNIQESSDLVVQGQASEKTEILTYIRALEETDLFSNIILTLQSKDDTADVPGITFKIQLQKGE